MKPLQVSSLRAAHTSAGNGAAPVEFLNWAGRGLAKKLLPDLWKAWEWDLCKSDWTRIVKSTQREVRGQKSFCRPTLKNLKKGDSNCSEGNIFKASEGHQRGKLSWENEWIGWKIAQKTGTTCFKCVSWLSNTCLVCNFDEIANWLNSFLLFISWQETSSSSQFFDLTF